MIGRQTIGPGLGPSLVQLLGEPIAIDVLVPVLEDDRLAPVAPRGDMVRAAGGDNAGEASHAALYQGWNERGILLLSSYFTPLVQKEPWPWIIH